MLGGVGKSFIGGGGKGPLGGGALIGSADVCNGALECIMVLLLLVLGGNIGRAEGSMAEAGSGILSLWLNPNRLGYELFPLGASCVSNDRCCNDKGGGGDLSTMPVGICCTPIGMSADVGVANFLAVTGVDRVSVVVLLWLEAEFPCDGSGTVPSLLKDFGAGGAR